MVNPDGVVTTWNTGAERIYGYTAQEIIGQNFSRFYPKEDRAGDKSLQELALAKERGGLRDEGWRLRKDGSRFWASIVITPIYDKSGELIGYGKVTRDLTEQKAAEEKLRRSEEQFRLLIDNVQEYAIFLLDPMGNVASWNSGAEKIKGYKASEIIGKNFVCFYTPEDVAAGKPQFNLGQATRLGHHRDQGPRVRKDGSIFEADIVFTALYDKSDQLRGFSKVTRDITDQMRAREVEAARIAAEKANQAKDDFLAALSHELRTPLTPALAAAGFLADNAAKFAPQFADELEIIRRNIQLEARLIDDLLDLTRITRGMLHLARERADAHELIRSALEIAGPTVRDKKLHVSLNITADNSFIWADPVRVEQIFWNLINNAVKFTGVGGHIDIRTTNKPANTFVFEIADSGIGIEPDRQRSLFKAFEHADSSVTRQFGGLGLGLTISKNLIEMHEGKIEVESAGRGQGATFRVTLPVARANLGETTPSRLPASHQPQKQLRILLVEDHGDTRRTLSSLLRHFGHTISIADCVRAALDAVKAEEFDAVLSDIALPDGSGYEIIARAKQTQPLKGIALTGFGMDEDVRRSREAGFDYHLTKPVDFGELRNVLSKLSTGGQTNEN